LRHLGRSYPHLRLYQFAAGNEGDLHAKVIVIDRRLALVGSSNLSRRGLLTNHELALVVEGPAVAEIGRAMDRLLASQLHTVPLGESDGMTL